MSNPADVKTKREVQPRTQLKVIKEAMKAHAIQNALSNVSDDVMTPEEYEAETQKAIYILEDAVFKIMAECNLYGDDSIITENNVAYPVKNTCKDFMEAVMSTVIENVDSQIN